MRFSNLQQWLFWLDTQRVICSAPQSFEQMRTIVQRLNLASPALFSDYGYRHQRERILCCFIKINLYGRGLSGGDFYVAAFISF